MIIHIIHTEILVESDQQEALRRHLIACNNSSEEYELAEVIDVEYGWESYYSHYRGALEIHTDNDYLELDDVEKFLSAIANYCVMLEVNYTLTEQVALRRYILRDGILYREMGEISWYYQKTVRISGY